MSDKKELKIINDLTPAQKFIFHLFKENEILTPSKINEITLLSRRTISHAIKRLLKEGLIEKTIKKKKRWNEKKLDKRKSHYKLNEKDINHEFGKIK